MIAFFLGMLVGIFLGLIVAACFATGELYDQECDQEFGHE